MVKTMFSRAYVEITNVCNLRCSFCHGHSRPPKQMTREEFLRVLSQMEGVTRYVYYHLMGEPLLHPLLPEFLTLAKQRGFASVLTTNGTLLNKRGQALLAAGVHKVSISLHSFEAGQEDAHRAYLKSVCDFAERAQKKDTIVSMRLWNRGAENGNDLTEAFLRQALPGVWAENTRGYRIRDKVFLEYGDRFGWPDMDNPEEAGKVTCYGMQDHFGILCDGTVVPCCLDSDGVIALGNVFSMPLKEILDTDRAKNIRQSLQKGIPPEDLCRRCPYAAHKR